MKVSIFGTGYVGLVTGACLSHSGHDVTCVDVDKQKVEKLLSGHIPIYEPGLETIVKESVASGRLNFTTDAQKAVEHSEIIFIAVGTPPDEDGAADLQYVIQVADTVGQYMPDYRVVINKSTVPVGSGDRVKEAIAKALQKRKANINFDVASNPEFLKEGAAVSDFMKPDRIIVGTDSDTVREKMQELYAPFNRNRDRLMFMDVRSAELTKYAANAMLATKISFMNELSGIADQLGADVELVRLGIGSDPRIGYSFIYPGCGYGGSCFPKDVKALVRTARSVGEQAQLLNAVEEVNDKQKSVLVTKSLDVLGGAIKGATVAIWGLAFKPNTDDMREAPSRTLMEALWKEGAIVSAYDPEAREETQRIYEDEIANKHLTLHDDPYAALERADILVICTEWAAFRSPDWAKLKQLLKRPVIIDGRNMYDPQLVAKQGFEYRSIGRPVVKPEK